MNNCGYNPIHTDMIGGSWAYPEASYSERDRIWQAHVDYTKGFLWFMSSDDAVPAEVRRAYSAQSSPRRRSRSTATAVRAAECERTSKGSPAVAAAAAGSDVTKRLSAGS